MAHMPANYSSTGPDRDTRFILDELLQVSQYAEKVRGYKELCDPEMGGMMIDTANSIAGSVLAFHNGDSPKPKLEDSNVVLSDEMKALYDEYFESGFQGLTAEGDHGGAELPELMNTIVSERLNSADISWTMLPILIQGGYAAIRDHGSDDLKAMFLPGAVEGKVSFAMDMTEPGAGTGLGDTKARAEKDGDVYKLTGTKIFITFGDHDATENIVHLVLARLPDAPAGVKGLTLFAVPKLIDGQPNQGVSVGGIEQAKLGLHHSPTCSMNYDGAIAHIIGEEHGGIKAMFTMMNEARLHVGVQAIGAVETAYQNALEYVRDTRVVDGKPLIEKEDVRRKLLSMRSMVESGRSLAAFVSLQMDIAHHHPDAEEKAKAGVLVNMLTPVVKGYFTDRGVRAVREGLELYGGYGYTEEYPLARLDRDMAVTPIYEGVNAVQATAILRSLKNINVLTGEMQAFADANSDNELAAIVRDGAKLVEQQAAWLAENKDEMLAGATDFMHLLGTVVSGYMLARSAVIAEEKLQQGAQGTEKEFYEGKIDTAAYFVRRELQRYTNPLAALQAGKESVRMRDQIPETDLKPGAVAGEPRKQGEGPDKAAGAARQ